MEKRTDLGWMKNAACADFDTSHKKLQDRGVDIEREQLHPEIFFQPGHDKTRHTLAKKVCQLCEVQAECLNYALGGGTKTAYGVYGGLTDYERQTIKKRQTR